ncbi:MAG: sigma-54-dependent Fis family transcriptional regulator [Desulfobacteraceae bacterium]|nr:sigma-54-dependent Fis family transcriptional regulator [Desulfobacteraceae bacterium]MBC2719350.1 sigma-54-dependent Fis family transcriptional regulator [Desulfobacteraceae bacterium]
MDNSIVLIDNEPLFLNSVRRRLNFCGFKNVRSEQDPNKAAALFKAGKLFDVALIDVMMPETSGIELLDVIKNTSPNTECLMVTAINEVKVAVECLKKGACDYLVKPISGDTLGLAVKCALERKRVLDILHPGKKMTSTAFTHREAFRSIITRSPKVLKLLKEAELHAASDIPVLITGESGTGKELLARAIHCASSRTKFPFTPINMASVTGSLFDAEFFGCTRGAFTGAEKARIGHLEQTNKGTLLLDEIGDLPPELQGKLLRVLQEGEYLKLGTSKPQKTDVRFISATNADLNRLKDKGMFRKDFYYRLKGALLHLPPLRERKKDILLLADKFLKEFSDVSGKKGISEKAGILLINYDYPGNIRELRSIIQLAVNLAQGRQISANCLPTYLRKQKPVARCCSQKEGSSIASLKEVEKAHILKVYEQTGRIKTQTAKLLAIGLNTLRRKLQAYCVA